MIVIQWSKTKSTLESFLCDPLKGRVKIYSTVYRKFHDSPSRVWITLDNIELISASDVTYQIKHGQLYQKLKKEQNVKDIPFNDDWKVMLNSPEREELTKIDNIVEEYLINESIFPTHYVYSAFMEYSSLSIEEALYSNNIIIKAYAMFDRRLGKRRLKNINYTVQDTHPLVWSFYKIRCDVEEINIEST